MSPLKPISQEFNQNVAKAFSLVNENRQVDAIQVFIDWHIPDDKHKIFWENVRTRFIAHLGVYSYIPLTTEKAKEIFDKSVTWLKDRGQLKSKIAKEKDSHKETVAQKVQIITELQKLNRSGDFRK